MLTKLIVRGSWLTGCLVFFTFFISFAQRVVTGRITTGPDKQPVYGATVAVKNSTIGTQTGPDGTFRITVPNDRSVLVVSFVGYESTELNVGTQTSFDIPLRERTSTLTDVVVTGYSSQAKKDITGSVAVVKVEDLKSVPYANAESQLQGRASGVTVITDNRPGAGASVRIRGFASFGGNEPLYIIDGVPAGGLGGLNPNDIESMQVLKDAASASIYGARASNGVIVVTTKKGRSGPAKVTYNMYYGSQNPGKGFNLLNSQEMADLTWLAYKNAGQTPPSTQYGSGATPVLPDYILPAGRMEGDSLVNPARYNLNLDNINASYLIARANKQGTDWFDVLTESAPMMNHNLNVSGGGDRSRYMMSFDYFDQRSIVIFSFYKRYTMRVNTEFNIKNNIRIGENLQVLYSEDNGAGNNGEGTEIGMAYRNQPIIPVFDIMGNFAGSRAPNLGNASNPYALRARRKDNRGHNFNFFGNIYAEVDFLKHFTARTSFGGSYNNNNFYNFSHKTYENSENNTNNSYTEGFSRFRSWTWTNQLTFRKTFGEHNVTALVGTEAVEDWGRSIQGTRVGYFTEDVNFRSLNSGGAGGQQAVGSPGTPSALASLFGKLDYVLQDKYLASFTIRRDGSSRFGAANRYGVFPSASIGWRVSGEKFMQDVNWITDLKLRASYGTMGNQRINPANQFDQFVGGPGSSNYDINGSSNSTVQGFQQSFVGNPLGKWETNITKNIGFDATLFGGKTEIIFEYYNKDTRDLLFRLPAIATAGAGAASNPAFFNVASMSNKGIDIMITQRGNIGRSTGLTFDATLTFTTYKNRIESIAEGLDFYDTRGSRIGNWVRNQTGHPLSAFYGYKVIGLFQDSAEIKTSPLQDAAGPGRFKYADLDNNDTINIKDRTFLGDPNPDFTYGLNLNIGFKGFDLSAFFYGVKGRQAMNYVRWWTDFFPSFQGNKSKDALYNSWTPQRRNTRIPIAENASNFSTNTQVSDYYLENASFLRMKNLTLGYTVPSTVLNRFKVDRLRVYVQATNLFTITKYTGMDPEIIGGDDAFGIDEGIFPTVRQYLIGVNLNF